MVRQTITLIEARKAACPVRVRLPQGGGRPWIRIESQINQRGCAPSCPGVQTGGRPPETAKPGSCGARTGSAFIARTRDNRNRHGAGDLAPVPPAVKLRQIVAPHQPHELHLGVAPAQRAQGIERVARAQFALDRGGHDSRAAGLLPGRSQPRRQRRHPGFGLKRVTRRDQPPHRIEVQGFKCPEANTSVPAMRRVETAAEEPDSGQGLICPVPRTSHL